MLTHLEIRDLAIVDHAELSFGPGLTVLTGETGAGKSIVVDALTLASGARATPDLIRGGATRAEIAATFDIRGAPRALRDLLDEQSVQGDDELLVRRVITADGRSRAWLNGQAVPAQLLRTVVGQLVDVHGQHEFQSLVQPVTQRELLDGYGRLESLTGQVQAAHRVWFALLNRLLEVEGQLRDRDARLDLLRHQHGELEALGLAQGEFAELGVESSRLANRSRLLEAAQDSLQQLYEGEELSAHSAVAHSLGQLRAAAEIDAGLQGVLPLLEEASIRINEASRELSRYVDSLDLDAGRQSEVERRLAAIEDLARKHRVPADQLPARQDALAQELEALERAEQDVATLRRQQTDALAAYRALAARLSAERATAGRAFAKDISQRMQTLGMAGGRFQVEVMPHESAEPQQHGLDQIEFRVTANPGQPLRALSKVASGGELARLSLAVQVAGMTDERRCMVFDEVDSGIGGAVAEIVGQELRSLGQRAQVLCVTHLPQVAAQGHQHFRVVKSAEDGQTRTRIVALAGDDRVQEIARMLGGVTITSRALEHAREMLAQSEEASPAGAGPATPRGRGRRKTEKA